LGGGQTTGQPATPGAAHNGAAEIKGGRNATEERGEQTKPNRTGEAQPNRNRETTGQAPQNERQENRTEGNKATNGATEERRLDQNRATEERGRDNDRNRTTTGQGAAPNKGNVSVNITPEKRTQIRRVFTKERSAPRRSSDFSPTVSHRRLRERRSAGTDYLGTLAPSVSCFLQRVSVFGIRSC
jgi:hypothetical protein